MRFTINFPIVNPKSEILMYFQHSPKIWNEFPQLAAGALIVDGIHADVDVMSHLEPWFDRARERLEGTTESQLPEIAAWRRAYSQMGMKPTKYRSAAEALLRRFRREDDLPRLHPLVDLCNAVSLAFALPIAVYDLDPVDTFLEVRHATGTETHLAFNGETETPPTNEVIFADASNHAHARRWTFRQSRQSTVSANTARVLIVSEGLHETATEDIATLISALSAEITELWTMPRQEAMLSIGEPRVEF